MQTIKTWFYWLASLLMLSYLLHEGKIIIFPLVLSVILVIMFSPIIKKVKVVVRSTAVAFIIFYLLLAGVLGIGLFLFGGEVSDLFSKIDSSNISWDKAEDRLEQILRTIGFWDGEWEQTIANRLNAMAADLSSFLGSMISSGTNVLISTILTLVFAFFITVNYQSVKGLLLAELEKPKRKRFKSLIEDIPVMMRSYFRGLGIVMVVLAIANSLLFWLVGLEYAWVWGIVVGTLSIIPYIGTMIGLLLPLSYSFISAPGFTQPILIMIGFGIIQQIEGNILTPKIVGQHVNLNAFTALLSTIVAGLFWGVAGAVIAIPTAGVIKLLLEQWDESRLVARLMGTDLYEYSESNTPKEDQQKSS